MSVRTPQIPTFDLNQIKQKLTSQPQIQVLITNFNQFWLTYGQKVKYASIAIAIFIVILVAVNLGRNLAALNRPQITSPDTIPTVVISPEVQKVSVFTDLKQQITDFSPLLPDPAPPAVDADITLLPPKR